MNYSQNLRFLCASALTIFLPLGSSAQEGNSSVSSEEEVVSDQSAKSQVPAAKLSLNKLVVALKANKNPQAMLEEREALQTYLSDKSISSKIEIILTFGVFITIYLLGY